MLVLRSPMSKIYPTNSPEEVLRKRSVIPNIALKLPLYMPKPCATSMQTVSLYLFSIFGRLLRHLIPWD